jgi:hypothetical protein
MHTSSRYIRLFFALLAEVIVLLSLFGIFGPIEFVDIFLGYFVGLFWFIIIFSISLELQSKRIEQPTTIQVANFVGNFLLFVLLTIYLTFVVAVSDLPSSLTNLSAEAIQAILYFSAIAIIRSTVEVLLLDKTDEMRICYEKRKIFHDGLVKLLLGLIGIVFVLFLPYSDPETFSYFTATNQLVIFCIVFLIFIIQDIWFHWIEQNGSNYKEKEHQADTITKYILILLATVFFGITLLGS